MTAHPGIARRRTTSGVVVVGCDGSWDSLQAVEAAAHEAANRHTSLAILAMPSPGDLYADTLDDVIRRERASLDRGEAVARRAEDRARAVEPKLSLEVVVTLEHSTELIALAARAGLLVLGRHGRGGQTTFSLGSTSAALSRTFRVPVLVTGATGRGTGIPPHPKVVVGLSGAAEDAVLGDVAIAEAWVRHWPLVAVRALLGTPAPGDDARQVVAAEAGVWETLSVSTRMAAVHVRSEVLRGDPVEGLVSHCGPEDLLILGNRGAGHLSGVVSGSLTLRVVDAAPCDVLLVPAGARVSPRHAADPAASSTEQSGPLVPA
jgi:nucleotide-binding universal stress UspA family protein